MLKDIRGVFLPPAEISGLGEPGSLLLKSLRREPTGIPPSLLSNINRLLETRGQRGIQDVRSQVSQLGGATGTSQSSLLTDLGIRGEQAQNLQTGEAINRNFLQDVLLRSQESGQIGQLRLGGAGLQGQLGQARSSAERGLFGLQEGVRAQQRQALPSGFEQGGRALLGIGGLLSSVGGLESLLGSFGKQPRSAFGGLESAIKLGGR